MKTLNLIKPEQSEIKYSLTVFPDGEPQISFPDEFDRKDSVNVICRITSTEELFILTQVGDILDRQEIEWDLYITYLMSMRMDRVMDFNRPFSLKIVCNILNSMNYHEVHILEPHSEKTLKLLKSSNYSCFVDEDLLEDYVLVLSDKGAEDRYDFLLSGYVDYVIFDKVRDLKTGKIQQFNIAQSTDFSTNKFMFIDDLCDAGGTFLGELEILKKEYPNGIYNIMVCHAVNPIGIKNLCEHFDNVIITNSFADFDAHKYKNLTIIDVCNNDD